jgi:hypothetical protein
VAVAVAVDMAEVDFVAAVEVAEVVSLLLPFPLFHR